MSRVVTQLALAYPDVGFTLTSAGRTVLECPPALSLRDRLYQLYGDRADLLEVAQRGRRPPGERLRRGAGRAGPTRGPQHVFVNRRIVKDRTIAHAIIDAYSVASIKERSPEVHLFIEMPADAVDVNVHPTKAEVRFRDQSLVHEVVRRGLMDALGQGGVPQLQLQPEVRSRSPRTCLCPACWPAASIRIAGCRMPSSGDRRTPSRLRPRDRSVSLQRPAVPDLPVIRPGRSGR